MSEVLPRDFTSAELSVPAQPATPHCRGYWGGVGKRLSRDPVTLVCAGVLLLMLTVIVLAPLVALYDPY